MPLNTASVPVAHLTSIDPRFRPLLCLLLLVGACALASLVLACATPFAAFAVVAAAMLPAGPALLVVAAAWLVNQAIGFGMLHYPIDTNTVLWGLIIGVAALVATITSMVVLRVMPWKNATVALGVGLIGAFAA